MRVPVALIAAASSALLRPAAAVLVDEAWNVDYHLALLGTPQEHTTSFHQPFAGSRASLLYTLSEQAVLGAVNPKDGSIVWRQPLDHASSHVANTTPSFLRAGYGQDVVVSAVNEHVAAWSAADGRQVWSHHLRDSTVKDLEILEIPGVKEELGSKDAIVLSSNAHTTTLTRLDGADGHAKWTFTDDSGDEAHQVSASATQLFCIFLHKTMLGGLKIKVVTLDPTNGRKIDQYTLSSESDLSSAATILAVGANTASPIIAWTDKARTVLKVNVVGSKHTSTFAIDASKPVESIILHAPYNINARPHFLVHYQTAGDHWAEVYHIDLSPSAAASAVSQAYSLPRLAGHGVFSTSASDANVYFTRISEGELSVVSSASHGVLARWPLKISQPGLSKADAVPLHAVSDISVKADTVSAIRSAIYLTSGDWILVRDGVLSWYRPEALSQVLSATWAYPAVERNLVHELEVEGHSNMLSAYIHRVTRHINDLKKVPAALSALPARFSKSLGVGPSDEENSAVTQDLFGFHKTVVCATANGRLIALDAGSAGKTLWNIPLPELEAAQKPQIIASPDGNIIVKSVDGKILRDIDALTGSDTASDALAPPAVEISQKAYKYTFENGKLAGNSPATESSWQFIPFGGQQIISVTPRPLDDPVASIGKVLGDRKVLYKYLNPNILLVTAVSDETKTASVSVVDAVSGTVLYTALHEDVDVTLPIASTISENWFAYSFTSASEVLTTKGHQLVIGEMYESELPNDRGPYGSSSNASAIDYSYEPYVFSKSFAIDNMISHMAVTQTRQGITSRMLLAVLPHSNAVVGIPRQIIDPRRPVGRDPTPGEQMEGLMKYDPVLRFDPKWYLTHHREVLGVEKITTSPAVLESTSLVFAYGLDIFGTRVNPSFSFDILGKDFNKLQMLATVVALFIATVAVAPLVKRKQINARWQFAG
ncbi:hypothetical protein AAFC00_000155 [Neodothiora populina]|uniref:ER membrane protein complex subunit 1 n=1 Tax=Neodothiora populina TaxID=2781224 RepID=A0ABR3P2D7_9PEZI